MANKPLSKWLTRKAGKKPIGAPPLADQTDGKRVNNFDQDGPAAIHDGLRESDPNAMGPRMRPVYDECASPASHWADQHDANPEDVPFPRIQSGPASEGSQDAGFRGRTGDDERYGPAGRFDPEDYRYAGKKTPGGPREVDGDASNVMPGRRNRGK